MPRYVVYFILFASIYAMIVFGACPSASPQHELSFTFLHNLMKISFMSIFARFMYVSSNMCHNSSHTK